MIKKLLISAVILLILISCGGVESEIELLPADESRSQSRDIEYGSFFEAMENLDFGYIEKHSAGDDEKRFALGLKAAVAGDSDTALTIFAGLMESSKDQSIIQNSARIYAEMLFYLFRWEEFLQFIGEENKDDGNAAGRILAQAFKTLPEEEYIFGSGSIILPIELSRGGNPVVEVKVNGQVRKFWIDTGADLSVIADDVADECNIKPIGEDEALAGTATTKKINFQPAVIDRLQIGDITVRNHPVMILDAKDMQLSVLFFRIFKVEGIIGWPLLKNMTVEIDYIKKQVTFSKPGGEKSPDPNMFWLGKPTIKLHTDKGIAVNFGLDTGARKTSITKNLLKKVSISGMRTGENLVGSAGGWDRMKTSILPELRLLISGYMFKLKDVSASDLEQGSFLKTDGTIGSDILARGRVLIDYPSGRFLLEIPGRDKATKNQKDILEKE